jgi:CheY-like chemotaxis protein
LAGALALEPQLVITDLQLPEPDGIGVARGLTGPDGTRPMPVVLVSAHVDAVPNEVLRETFDAVIPKPVDPERLVAVARSLLEMAG